MPEWANETTTTELSKHKKPRMREEEAGQTWEEKERRRDALEMALADAIGGRAEVLG